MLGEGKNRRAGIQGVSEGKIDKVRYEVVPTLGEVEGKTGDGENE